MRRTAQAARRGLERRGALALPARAALTMTAPESSTAAPPATANTVPDTRAGRLARGSVPNGSADAEKRSMPPPRAWEVWPEDVVRFAFLGGVWQDRENARRATARARNKARMIAVLFGFFLRLKPIEPPSPPHISIIQRVRDSQSRPEQKQSADLDVERGTGEIVHGRVPHVELDPGNNLLHVHHTGRRRGGRGRRRPSPDGLGKPGGCGRPGSAGEKQTPKRQFQQGEEAHQQGGKTGGLGLIWFSFGRFRTSYFRSLSFGPRCRAAAPSPRRRSGRGIHP